MSRLPSGGDGLGRTHQRRVVVHQRARDVARRESVVADQPSGITSAAVPVMIEAIA